MFSCKIVPCDQQYQPIVLRHQTPLVIGRGPLTRIKDPRLSRSHRMLIKSYIFLRYLITFLCFYLVDTVELLADCNSRSLNVKFIGENACKAGLTVLKEKNSSAALKEGDQIELLLNQYLYRVEFDSGSSGGETSSTVEMVGKQTTLNGFLTKRKSCDDQAASNSDWKKQKTEESWLEVDGGKLIVFTSSDVQHKSKV